MTLQHLLSKTPEFVFEYLTDMQKYVSVHPVIYKIEQLEKDRYKIFETLKLGFIPYSFTYQAVVAGDPLTKIVNMKADVMDITTIEMIFSLNENGAGCIVKEEIYISSVLPIKSVMERILREQHSILFENIEKV